VFSNATRIPPRKPSVHRARSICFFWCNFHHTSDPSFLALTKKSLAVAPRFFLQKFKLKLTKTNASQSLNKGFESHMRKLTSVDLIPHFLHIFSIPLLSKKTTKRLWKHIWQTKIRENETSIWKRVPPWKFENERSSLKAFNRANKFQAFWNKIALGHFFQASQMQSKP